MSFPEIPLIKKLKEEHDFLDRVMASLYHWADEGQDEDPEARELYLRFLSSWAEGYHHRREEEFLFPVLISALDLRADNGPIRILLEEHEASSAMLEQLKNAAPGEETLVSAKTLVRHMWEHIDKENSVLFAEGNERLVRVGKRNLKDREITPEEAELERIGELLISRWDVRDDPDHIRGDGCMACSAYGETCSGIESEWWNQWEWERHDSYQG